MEVRLHTSNGHSRVLLRFRDPGSRRERSLDDRACLAAIGDVLVEQNRVCRYVAIALPMSSSAETHRVKSWRNEELLKSESCTMSELGVHSGTTVQFVV
jgi:hypothetical protein